jgi:predicted dehydrogenase
MSKAQSELIRSKQSPGAAIVGTGFIGPVHIEALRRLGRPVAGVLASSPTRSREAARRLNLPRGYDDFEALLADPAVQVVHLASPNRLHYEQCKQALAAGKHVVCEKPLAMTSRETAELVELAAASQKVAALCYNVRFYPLCQEVRRRIQDGQFGTIYHVTGSYVQDWLFHEDDFNWRVLAEEGGPLRAVADIGTHWMDLILWMTELTPSSVCADLATCLPTRRRPRDPVQTFQGKSPAGDMEKVAVTTEDYGSILLRFQEGARGNFTVSQVTAGRKNRLSFEIAGSTGSCFWDSELPNQLWLGNRDQANQLLMRDPALLHPKVRPLAFYPGGHNEGYPDTFKQLFDAIYRYVDLGDMKSPPPFPTFADGHREALLCDAILASHNQGGWVNCLPAQPPT